MPRINVLRSRWLSLRSGYGLIFLVPGSIPYLGLDLALAVLQGHAFGRVLNTHGVFLVLGEGVLDKAGAEASLPDIRVAD